jgi:hypothetical protein
MCYDAASSDSLQQPAISTRDRRYLTVTAAGERYTAAREVGTYTDESVLRFEACFSIV